MAYSTLYNIFGNLFGTNWFDLNIQLGFICLPRASLIVQVQCTECRSFTKVSEILSDSNFFLLL